MPLAAGKVSLADVSAVTMGPTVARQFAFEKHNRVVVKANAMLARPACLARRAGAGRLDMTTLLRIVILNCVAAAEQIKLFRFSGHYNQFLDLTGCRTKMSSNGARLGG